VLNAVKMPEIAEIARITHFLRVHLLSRTISSVIANDDPIVFDSKPSSQGACTASSFISALTGKKVVGVGQQGKYFWLELDKSPHPLMHFGMTGWIFIRVDGKDVGTPYWAAEKAKTKGHGGDEWPPRFEKFRLILDGSPKVEASFVDARRLGRVRLIDVPKEKLRASWPLSDNGPDPVIDKTVLTREWLGGKLKTKKVPVKAWLLDQANISGVGNWVGYAVFML
jgi:formamidopyrimidine-DNA glycosylase